MSNTAEQLKQEILEKVREYATVAHSTDAFVPYKTKVRYAGRVDKEFILNTTIPPGRILWAV